MDTCIRHPAPTGSNDYLAGADPVYVDVFAQGSALYKQRPLPGLYLLLHGGHGSPSNDFSEKRSRKYRFAVEATTSGTASMASFTLCSNSLPKSIALRFKMAIFHRSPVLTGRQHVSNTQGVQGGFARSENRQRQAGSAQEDARPAIQSGRAEKRRARFTFTVRTEARMHSDAFLSAALCGVCPISPF